MMHARTLIQRTHNAYVGEEHSPTDLPQQESIELPAHHSTPLPELKARLSGPSTANVPQLSSSPRKRSQKEKDADADPSLHSPPSNGNMLWQTFSQVRLHKAGHLSAWQWPTWYKGTGAAEASEGLVLRLGIAAASRRYTAFQ